MPDRQEPAVQAPSDPTIEVRGSARIQEQKDSVYAVVAAWSANQFVLKDKETGNHELWMGRKEPSAGFNIKYGPHYLEFVRSLAPEQLQGGTALTSFPPTGAAAPKPEDLQAFVSEPEDQANEIGREFALQNVAFLAVGDHPPLSRLADALREAGIRPDEDTLSEAASGFEEALKEQSRIKELKYHIPLLEGSINQLKLGANEPGAYSRGFGHAKAIIEKKEKELADCKAELAGLEEALAPSLAQMGKLAKQCGMDLPLRVMQSGAGHYIGTQDEDGMPFSRESQDYFPSREAAAEALETGRWTQKQNP
jgi:hypothetical protein